MLHNAGFTCRAVAATAAAQHAVGAHINAIWCCLKKGLEVWVQAYPGEHTPMVAYMPLHLDRVGDGLKLKRALYCCRAGGAFLGVWRRAQQALALQTQLIWIVW
jgi:hypothetical protein